MKKFISFFLISVLLSTVLCACSSGNNSDVKNETGTNYKISYTYDNHYSSVSESAVRAYNALCEAIINGENSVLFNTALLSDVNKLYYTSFPLNYLVKSLSLNSDKTGLNISYNNDTNTHVKLVEEFNQRVDDIMQQCGYGKVDKSEYILNVYNYIASNTKYDNSCTTAYDAIVNSIGSSPSFASAFEYILAQGDISVSHVYAVTDIGVVFMTETELNGELYYFNPGNERLDTDGIGLSYFGMSYADLLNLNLASNLVYTDGAPVVFDDTTEKFATLRNTVSYKYENGIISANKNNGEIVECALK